MYALTDEDSNHSKVLILRLAAVFQAEDATQVRTELARGGVCSISKNVSYLDGSTVNSII